MKDNSILLISATKCGVPALEKHRLGYDPLMDMDSVFVDPAKEVFARVIVYDMWKRYAEIGVNKVNKELLDLVLQESPKFLLWISMEYEIKETILKAVRRAGVKTIGWFFDDEMRFDEYSRWWIPYLDVCLTCDKESVSRYERLGGRALHCLSRANPDVFKKMDMPFIYDVTFIGRKFGERAAWLQQLAEGGIKTQAFGSGWPNGFVSTAEMVRIYNQSRINLNFVQSYGKNTRPQIKGRFFEVCLSGGFLLSEYILGIEEFFEINREIVCFESPAEAIEKIKYYLSHEAERQAIAQAGWSRAQRDHTQQKLYEKTFQQIEKILGEEDKSKTISARLEMPSQVRRLSSYFHYNWAKGLMIEGYAKKRWQEELELALYYDPGNVLARRLRIIGKFSAFARPVMLRYYHVLDRLKNLLDITLGIYFKRYSSFRFAKRAKRTISYCLRKLR